jgi:hypothetical protein
VVDKDGWHLSTEPTEKLDQDGQDRLAHLKSWLAKHMRRVKLPDLLIEVDNQLGFTRNFLALAQREEPLVLHPTDARTEAQAQHGEGSEVNILAKYIYWSYAYWSPPEGEDL